ncbi:DMT family protein [Auraticoccus monumenti]|uniref:Magnesium transporter NIPA n=1 Tax=Auraticoccus monumenti TaxID=675864 RepID=A0A1G7EJN9_9ACTN|nr:hypothetical protein [Auraticoccus monumenti]SDE63900.1 hypothetical protein SAMN04489747_3969 [Auraticoccus monumenti]
MTTAAAIGLGLVAAVCFALAAAYQHRAVGRHVDRTADSTQLSARHFWALVRTPRWLAGTGLAGLGAVLHINALRLAPVAVVQPVGVVAVPLSVLLTARRTRTRPPPVVWAGVLATVLGVFGFVLLTARSSRSEVPVLRDILVVSAVLAVICCLLVLAAKHAPGRWPTLLWASAGACAFGLASAYVKALFLLLGARTPLTSPAVWGTGCVMLAAYVLGAWMVQHGYLAGSPEVVVGALTVTDPVVAVLIGLVLLGEGGFGLPTALGMILCAVLAVAGVVALSTHHPQVTAPVPDITHPPAPSHPSSNRSVS